MKKMKPYPEYKNSGIEWIGEMPSHWDLIRTRFVFDVISGNGFSDEFQGKQRGEFPFYKCSDINSFEVFVDKANNYVDQSDIRQNGWNVIPRNSILLAKIGEALKKNHRKINSSDCLIDNNMMSVVLRNVSEPVKYYYYLMNLINMEWFVNPGAVPSVDVSKFRSFFIPRVANDEQKNIADYLDWKTTQVDALIAKKERMIELLKKERSAVINQAGTRGLDPNIELKDSGIEWLGQIPKHWELKKLKYVGEVIIGLTYAPEEMAPLGTLVLRASNIQDGKIVLGDNVYVNKKIQDRLIIKAGDILICSRSGSRALIGKCAYIDNKYAGHSFGAFMTIFRGKSNRFVYHVFNSTMFAFHIGSFLTSTINQLTTENLNEIIIALPSVEEQNEIADFLDRKTARIDEQVMREEKSIELLKEYRAALISEVVTGKIDVRNNQ
jgi:type I restriction enzyme, S subunit